MFLKRLLAVPVILVLVSACGEGTTAVSPTDVAPAFAAGGPTNIDAFDMNDRFSGSGAKGSGTARVTDGQLNLTIHARDLEANHPYEVHLLVGPPNDPGLNLPELTAHIFEVSSDKNGKFEFKIVGFDLGLEPGSGSYRLDYVVLHDLAAPRLSGPIDTADAVSGDGPAVAAPWEGVWS